MSANLLHGEDDMKSRVRFELVSRIPIDQGCDYPGFPITAEVANSALTALSVEVEHDDGKALSDIVQAARVLLQPLCTLISIGRGIEPILGATTVSPVTTDGPSMHLAFADAHARVVLARRLKTLPPQSLLATLQRDSQLARQVDYLYSAEAAADIVSWIRYAYMVLEQEHWKRRGYTPLADFRHTRNAVSHPELKDADLKAFLQAKIGVEQIDLHNLEHIRFLEDQCWRLLEEARRIVETEFASLGSRFWC
jgi:hypothetical protein